MFSKLWEIFQRKIKTLKVITVHKKSASNFALSKNIPMGNYSNYQHSELTSEIIKAAYFVHDYLGFGFLESVYEQALEVRLLQQGYDVIRQHPIKVYFEGEEVGNFKADLIVNDLIILELKAVETIHKRHEVQLVNYLKSTEIEIGLLINFGEKLEIKRRVFSNSQKKGGNRIPNSF